MKKIAIVGSREQYWAPEQRSKAVKEIKKALFKHMTYLYDAYETVENRRSVTLISGACPYGGVDVWAEVIADLYDIPKIIFSPKENNWKSYSERNLMIANECDIIYCFQPEQKPKGGGTWTLDQAENLGKEVHLIIVCGELKK